MYDVIVFQNLRFRPSTKKSDKPAFLKNSTLQTLFLNMCFWYPRTPFTCRRKVETEKRVRLRVKKYRHTCGRDLNIVSQMVFRTLRSLRSILTDNPPSPGKVGYTTGVYVPNSFRTMVWVLLCTTRNRYLKVLWEGTYIHGFRPYPPRRLESLQMLLQRQHFLLSHLNKKALVRPGFESATDRRSLNWANRAVVRFSLLCYLSSLRHVPVLCTGNFRQLHSLVQESNNSLSYFMHVFTQNGTFVFYDNAEPFRETFVTVKEQGSSCPDTILSPITEGVLVELGVSNKEVRT